MEVSVTECQPPPKKTTFKKFITEKKLELLSKYTDSMTQEPPEKSAKKSHFALLIDEQLSKLTQRNRIIAEKRIKDVVFEIDTSH